jgi:hypothetical protein
MPTGSKCCFLFFEKRKILFLFFVVLLTGNLFAQKGWRYSTKVDFGVQVDIFHSKAQHFPGVRFFSSFNIASSYNDHFLTNYGLSISVYHKMLGNNLNPLVRDIQLDVVNTFGIGAGGKDVDYTKYYRTMGNGAYYNAGFSKDWSALISTNFVLNNHKRHQAVGTISATLKNVTLMYANDGAPPMSTLGIGDSFDRWWTGSGGIFIHNKENFNTCEILFDQFTGNSPLLYELSGVLGIYVPGYSKTPASAGEKIKDGETTMNTSVYSVRYFPMAGTAVEIGIAGSLRLKNGGSFGMQDMIHNAMGFPLHPNKDRPRFVIGGVYNYTYNEPF